MGVMNILGTSSILYFARINASIRDGISANFYRYPIFAFSRYPIFISVRSQPISDIRYFAPADIRYPIFYRYSDPKFFCTVRYFVICRYPISDILLLPISDILTDMILTDTDIRYLQKSRFPIYRLSDMTSLASMNIHVDKEYFMIV